MPRFKEMEQSKRSVIYAMWSEQKRRARNREVGSGARWSLFVTLLGGMQEFVDAIADRLPEGGIRQSCPVRTVTYNEPKRRWHVSMPGNEGLDAEGVILATPAFQAGTMLASIASAAAHELKEIPYASTATVSLAYRSEDFPHALDSFGFVVPVVESRKIMACTFSSLKYPGRAPEGYVLLRAFIGGSLQPELFHAAASTMAENVRAELAGLLGVTAEPLFSRIWRHPSSMPQYHVGHEARIQRIEAQLGKFPGLALAGSAYYGVGISDSVRTGQEAAEKIVAQLNGAAAI
jgi:oxygen-dependent protoporphyrinogen oxidase